MEALGIVLVVALAAVGIFLTRRPADAPAPEVAPAEEAPPTHPADGAEPLADPEQAAFATIRRSDPAFDPDAFRRRVGEMFLAYHAAFAKRDLGRARRFIDDRYYAVLADRVKAAGPPIGQPRIQVETVRAMSAGTELGMDRVRVFVSAGYAGRSPESRHLQEYWTLIRRAGTHTRAGVSMHNCPHCGAPADGSDPTRCAYCGQRLADPSVDWIVSRIDRE